MLTNEANPIFSFPRKLKCNADLYLNFIGELNVFYLRNCTYVLSQNVRVVMLDTTLEHDMNMTHVLEG